MKEIDNTLLFIAEQLAEEIREGKWDNVYNKFLPITFNNLFIIELEKRCPGFTKSEYKYAIALGMQNTR